MAVINGTPAGEPLNGTAGSDTITGAGGADTITMLGGNDLALWSFGDGGDVVEGGAGTDTARFSSTGGVFLVSGGAGRVFVADSGGASATIVDLNDVERLELFANAFYNTVTVGDLSGTDLTNVTVNLAGADDFVTATASGANNTISVTTAGKNASITGLPTIFTVANIDGSDAVNLHGADGNDKLDASKVGAGRLYLLLHGDDGNDTVIGSVNSDALDGGTGNDTIIGGRGNDNVVLGSGNDLFLWNAFDGFDTINGGGDFDTARFTLSNASEAFGLSSSQFYEVERVEIRALGGGDSISVNKMTGVAAVAIDLAATAGGKTADTKTDSVWLGGDTTANNFVVTTAGSKIFVSGLDTELSIDHAGKTDALFISGGGGNDLIDASALAAGKMILDLNGESGDDTVIGSAGNDTVRDSFGDDVVSLLGGNDVIDWRSSGDELIDGGAGFDRLLLDGSDGPLDIGNFLGHTLLSRSDGSSITMDGVERIEVGGYFGVPSLTIRDLTGLGVQQVAVDLHDVTNKATNGVTDFVHATGTAGDDKFGATLVGGVIGVTGLATALTIAHAEKSDILGIHGADGNDLLDMSKIANVMWVGFYGETGFDTLRFTGLAGAEETTIISVVPKQFAIQRSDGAVTNGLDVERIELNALGGADAIKIGDLSQAGIAEVAIDLAATLGGKTADTKIDKVSIEGTVNGESIFLGLVAGKIVETGLPHEVAIDHAGKTDVIIVHGGFGGDTIDASAIPAGKIAMQLFGDNANDLIFGSAGDDTIEGGTGNDTAILGLGNDTYNWFELDGNDLIVDQGGTDTFKVFGNDGVQDFALATTSGRLIFSSASDGATVDVDNVERVEILAAAGTDSVTVHDLAGTDVKLVSVDLGKSSNPAGDSQADTVVIEGTGGGDAITASLLAGAVSIKGLPAQVSIAHVEAIDTMSINAGAGNDSISVAALPTKVGHLILVGGDGDDKLTGNLGSNVLNGGNDNDNLNGGGGNDTLTGAAGNDTVTGGAGNDAIFYTSVLDGHDVVIAFDGNAAGGQDVFDLDFLFDNLGVAAGNRAGRVSIVDKGASVEIAVDTDGDLNFDLAVATLKTADAITIGQDILVGT